jgi:hypothetical protein
MSQSNTTFYSGCNSRMFEHTVDSALSTRSYTYKQCQLYIEISESYNLKMA